MKDCYLRIEREREKERDTALNDQDKGFDTFELSDLIEGRGSHLLDVKIDIIQGDLDFF